MLEWLSTIPMPEEDDPDVIADDAPTTPGPVFAARAFKHLIWGTPAPEETTKQRPQPRRSASEPDHKAAQTPPRRVTIGIKKEGLLAEPSPGKQRGILLTPGTGGIRKKSVSFEHKDIAGEMGLVPNLSAPTPRDIPGRFPSPWTAKKEVKLQREESSTNQKKSTSTTSQPRRRASSTDDVTIDMTQPRSTSGTYWKSEYDSYSSKSTSEMRKLAKKEQLAKKYARHKDSEAATLAETLRHEQRRVADLEKQVSEYVNKLEVALSEVQEEKNKRRMKAEAEEEKMRREEAKEYKKLREENLRLRAELKEHGMDPDKFLDECASSEKKLQKQESKVVMRKQEASLSSSPLPLPQQLDGSDIWTASTRERPSRTRSRNELAEKANNTTYKSPARQPLSKRDANPIASSPFPTDFKGAASSNTTSYRRPDTRDDAKRGDVGKEPMNAATISEERKEAARKRLEEKKKARLGKDVGCV